MSGTKSTDDLQVRADHEAGHYITAHALGIITKPQWMTIQPRGESGGSVGIKRSKDSPLIPTIQYYLGGIVGEAAGRIFRRYNGTSPTEEKIKEELGNAFVQAFHDGGHGDAAAIDELLAERSSEPPPDIAGLRWHTFLVLTQYFDHFMLLAKSVRERETLYESEALFIIVAHGKPDTERGPMLKLLDKYRQERIAIAAPEEWFDGASDAQKAAPFYEGPVEYFRRQTGQT